MYLQQYQILQHPNLLRNQAMKEVIWQITETKQKVSILLLKDKDLSTYRWEGAYISMMLLKFPNSAGMYPTRLFLLKLLHE